MIGTAKISFQPIVFHENVVGVIVPNRDLFFQLRVNKGVTHEDFDKKRSRAAIRAQALKEMEKEKEVSF